MKTIKKIKILIYFMEQFKKLAKDKLGLNDIEALCYELLLIKGKLAADEILVYANLEEETDYEKIKGILDNFVERGLAQKIPKAKGLVEVYVGVAPFEALVKLLEDLSTEVGDQKKNIENSLQVLRDKTESELLEVRTNVETVIKDEKASIKESIAKANTTITEEVEKSISEHHAASDKCKQELEDAITAAKNNVSSKIEQFKKESGENISQFKEESSINANGTKDAIISKFEGLDNSVIELFNQAKTQFSSTLNTVKDKSISDVKSNQVNSTEKLNGWKGVAYTELENLSTSTGEKLDTNLSKLKTKNSNNVNSFKENFTKSLETFKTNLNNDLTSNREKFSLLLTELCIQTTNNISTLQNEHIEALDQEKSDLDGMVKEQKTNLNDFTTKKVSELRISFMGQLDKLYEGFKIKNEPLDDLLIEPMSKFFEFEKNYFTETKEQIANKFQATIEFLKKKFNEYNVAAKTKFDTIKSGLGNNPNLETQKAQLDNYLNQTLSDINNILTAQINNLDSSLKEQKEDFEGKLFEQMDKFTNFGKNFPTTVKDRFVTQAQSVIDFVEGTFKEYEDGTKTQFNTIKSEFENKYQGFSDNTTASINKLKEKSSSYMSSYEEEIKSKSAEFKNSLKSQQETMLSNIGTTLSENSSNFSDQLDSNLTEIEAGIEDTLNITKTDLEKSVSGSKVAVETSLSELNTEFDSLTKAFEEKVTADINGAISDISSKSDKLKDQISKSVADSNKIATDQYSNFITNLTNISDTLNEKSNTTANSTQSKIDADLTQLQNVYKMTVGKAINRFISSIDILKGSLAGEIETMDNDFTSATDKVGTEALDNIDNLSNNMLENFDSTAKSVFGSLDRVIEAANDCKNTLATIWEDVKTIELLKAEGTWQIVTKQTIMSYLAAMVQRTKLHFLIVVPSLDFLPIEAIMKTKLSQKMTIACKITNKELANKLIEKDNVDLRMLTEMAVSVIGADRDQEEAFYGPVTKNENEMVCAITQQDELIKIIAEMLSWFYRGRSRKYTKD